MVQVLLKNNIRNVGQVFAGLSPVALKMMKSIRKENPVISLVNSMLIDLPSPSNISYL